MDDPAAMTPEQGLGAMTPDQELAVLQARARELARPEESAADDASIEALSFRLAGETYAIETAFVGEVGALTDLTPVPCTPAFVRGLVNVRGQILCAVDLKAFYGLPDAGITDLDRLVIVRDGEVEVGVLADEVTGIHDLPVRVVDGAVQTAAGLPADHVKAVADGMILLDVQALLADPRLVVDEEVGP